MGLDRHVLFAAERAAVGHELDEDLVLGHPEETRHLAAVVEDALALSVEVDPVVPGHREGALRLEVEVLDALSLPVALDHVRARSQRRVDVTAGERRLGEFVGIGRVHLRRAVGDRRFGIEHRLEHLEVDLDQLRRAARDTLVFGGDDGDEVADTAGGLADRDEARPVRVDQAVPAVARHVGGGGDRDHTLERFGLRRVDRSQPRPRVGRQQHRAVQHRLADHVVDIRAHAEGHVRALIAGKALTDAAVIHRLGDRLAASRFGHELDRVDDLHVAGAATEVAVDGLGDLVAGGLRVLVEQVLRP